MFTYCWPKYADPNITVVLLQVRELGRGNFGVTMLMQDLQTSEYVAAKFIQRGAKVGALSGRTTA
jgi:hypothetical protein